MMKNSHAKNCLQILSSAAWAEAGGICFGITWLWLEKIGILFFCFFLVFFPFLKKEHRHNSITCPKEQKSDPTSNPIPQRELP